MNFPLSVAELSGELVRTTEGEQTLIQGWQHDGSIARWRFKLVHPAVFKVRIVYLAPRPAGASWELRVGEHTKSRGLQSSGDAAHVDEFIWKIPKGGLHTLELSVRNPPADAIVGLESLRLEKVDLGQ